MVTWLFEVFLYGGFGEKQALYVSSIRKWKRITLSSCLSQKSSTLLTKNSPSSVSRKNIHIVMVAISKALQSCQYRFEVNEVNPMGEYAWHKQPLFLFEVWISIIYLSAGLKGFSCYAVMTQSMRQYLLLFYFFRPSLGVFS